MMKMAKSVDISRLPTVKKLTVLTNGGEKKEYEECMFFVDRKNMNVFNRKSKIIERIPLETVKSFKQEC